jgi:predicted Zn-dependent peptidase
VQEERRQSYDNRPFGKTYEAVIGLAYDRFPYQHSTIGSMEDLNAATIEDAKEFFRVYYAPNNAVLTLVGDVDPDEALELVTKHFGHLAPVGELPPAPDGALDEPVPPGVRVTLEEKVPLPALYYAYRFPVAGDPDLYRLDVAFAVLANGRASVLQRRLVRGELAQGIGTSIHSLVAGASAGIVIATVRGGVELDTVEAVLREEILRLAEDGPTAAELERAKARLERARLDHVSSLAGRADLLSMYTTRYGEPGRINDKLPRLLAVTSDDVQAAVRRHLVDQHPAVIEYRPLAKEVAA